MGSSENKRSTRIIFLFYFKYSMLGLLLGFYAVGARVRDAHSATINACTHRVIVHSVSECQSEE